MFLLWDLPGQVDETEPGYVTDPPGLRRRAVERHLGAVMRAKWDSPGFSR